MAKRYATAPDGPDSRPWVIWDNRPDDGKPYTRYKNARGAYPEFATREKAMELVDALNAADESKPLPRVASDGRELVALRIGSHRARDRVNRATGGQVENWVGISSRSMRWPHVYLIPAELFDAVDRIPGVSVVSRFADPTLSWGPAVGAARPLTGAPR